MEKLYTLSFTDAELNLIYDALTELELSVDTEEEGSNISELLNKLYQVSKK